MKDLLKKLVVFGIVGALSLSLFAGCGGDDGAVPNDIPITIVANAAGAGLANANLMRDFLAAAGFDVTLDLQPDFAGWLTVVSARHFDIAVTSWTTIGGSPDYALRPIFHSTGDSNWTMLNNPRIDELIELAATQVPEEALATYWELEMELVVNNAYIFPLYRAVGDTSANITIIDQNSLNLPGSIPQRWAILDFVNPADRDTRPLVRTQIWPHLTSLDPVSVNDWTAGEINANIYIRIVSMTLEHSQITADGSLSWEFVIAEGNEEFYFVLRDDINFATVVDMQAVDTGVRVGACDVLFSLNRAADSTSVPDHRTFTLFEMMRDVYIVTDVGVLDTVRCAVTGNTMREVMEARTPTAITSLTDDKTQANNAAGVYQMIRVRSHAPFPQMLNYLAHQAASVLSAEQVSRVNDWDTEDFDMFVHELYGNQMNLTLGPTYNYHLWLSGPYVPIYRTDYNMTFQAHPAFKPGDYWAPRIRYVDMRFIPDPDAALSAFRAGDIYVLHTIDPAQHQLIHDDPDLFMLQTPSFFHAMGITNRDPGRVLECRYVRLAILYSICQDDIIAFYQGNAYRASSTISAMVDTGIVLERDLERVEYFLRRHWDSID